MNRKLIRSIHLASLLAAALLHIGCGADEPSDVPTWEEYRAAATRVFEGKESYVVDWDTPVSLDELRASYDRLVAEQGEPTETLGPPLAPEGVVNLDNGHYDIWDLTDRFHLTYCVSTEFGADHARMVAEMGRAARAWESAANINFIYLPAHDAACSNLNPNVLFSLRPWADTGACGFNPYEAGGLSGCEPRTVLINIDDLETNPFFVVNAPNMTTEGVLRHELGHVLGLRHEHARLQVCKELDWRQVTPYDEGSVMHYQWCSGVTFSDMTLTAADRRSVEALYGAPSPEPALHDGMRVRLRHASTGKCAYSYGGNGGMVHNWDCWNDPNMVFVLDAVAGGGYRLRHEASSQCIYTLAQNGSQARHWGCWNDPAMTFDLIPFLGGYRLRNKVNGQALYGNVANGGNVFNWGDWEDLNMIYFADPLAWTHWLDRDNPSGSGDFEDLKSFPPGAVCKKPTAIKCQALDGISHIAAEEVVTCTPAAGFACVNGDQPDGACEDYHVQFYCP